MVSRGSGPVHPTGPFDNGLSTTTRFLAELAAWVAGPWAAAELAGGPWAILPAAVLLAGIPAVFSTPGDKNLVLVATPGRVRVVIELLLIVVAIASAALVWPAWVAAGIAALALVMLATNARRFAWLWAGAPPGG